MGTCGFHCWDRVHKTCDIGYDLYPEFWGKGYMREAMEVLPDFIRSDMGIRCVSACIYIDNHRSIKLAEKLGFVWGREMKTETFRERKYSKRTFKGRLLYLHKIFTLNYKV